MIVNFVETLPEKSPRLYTDKHAQCWFNGTEFRGLNEKGKALVESWRSK